MLLNLPERLRPFAFLLLRVGAGAYMFLGHGLGKITAGPERWTELGGTMELIGISFTPIVWGFLAALAEGVGSLLLAAGFLTRTAALFLMGTMGMATTMHIMTGQGSPETAVIYLLVFTLFFLAGPGAYSVDAIMQKRR